jgi:circadian clock protein KaiB
MTSRIEPNAEGSGDAPAACADRRYELTLYVSGASEISARAIADARRLCDVHLCGTCRLSVVDITVDPTAVFRDRVLAVPTLVKNRPPPGRKFIGDLSDTRRVLRGLEISVAESAPPG